MKLVKEHIDFKRGLEPKDSMDTGLDVKDRLILILKQFQHDHDGGFNDFGKYKIEKIECNRWEVCFFVSFESEMYYKVVMNQIRDEIMNRNIDKFMYYAHTSNLSSTEILLNYKFNKEYRGLFDMKETILESYQFQRGIEPKDAMGHGILAEIQKFADEELGIDADSPTFAIDVVDHLCQYNTNLSPEVKQMYVEFLLPKMSINDLGEEVMEYCYDHKINISRYFKALQSDSAFTLSNENGTYIIRTRDWSNFLDYFESEYSRKDNYKKFIESVLEGTAMGDYFDNNYVDKDLDIWELRNIPLNDLSYITNYVFKYDPDLINTIDTTDKLFDIIIERAEDDADFRNLYRAIKMACSDTLGVGYENSAYKRIINTIKDHFNLEMIEDTDGLVFKIDEPHLNKFFYAYYIDDARIPTAQPEYEDEDFDVEVFKESLIHILED